VGVCGGAPLLCVILKRAARVLRPQGRLVAAVWAGPELCDIVLFQLILGRVGSVPRLTPGVGRWRHSHFTMATLFLMWGLSGSGETTLAKQLEMSRSALR